MNLLYLCVSYVEVDNFLPVYVELEQQPGMRQDICLLNYLTLGLDTPNVRAHLQLANVLTSLDFLSMRGSRFFRKLARVCSETRRMAVPRPLAILPKASNGHFYLH